MDTLIQIIISGIAVSFTVEFINMAAENFFSPRIIRAILTLPLALFAMWLLGTTGFTLAVAGPAAAYIAVAATQIVTRPATVAQVVSRR